MKKVLKMKKLLWLLVAFILTVDAIVGFSAPRTKPEVYSNVIFFGDSLSDLGNFPEAKYPLLNPLAPPAINNLYGMFYVPVSNPVSLTGHKINLVHLFSLDHAPYPWPKLNTAFLAKAPTINTKVRANHSISWTQYFTTDAHEDGVLETANIIPSMLLGKANVKKPVTYSVDYAFANATSTTGCNYEHNFKRFGACTLAEIQHDRQNFQEVPDIENYYQVLVPGLLKQIQLFETDLRYGRVAVHTNTLYVIWIGGNDFLKDLDMLKTSRISQKVAALTNAFSHLADNNEKAIVTLVKTKNINAKHIFLVGFPSPANVAPALQSLNSLSKKMLTLIVDHYNDQLQHITKVLNKQYPNIRIQYIPAPSWFKQMASPTGPFTTIFSPSKLGKACQLSSLGYDSANSPEDNCKGYMYWNAVHPSSGVEQILGYLMDKSIDKVVKKIKPTNEPLTSEFISHL